MNCSTATSLLISSCLQPDSSNRCNLAELKVELAKALQEKKIERKEAIDAEAKYLLGNELKYV